MPGVADQAARLPGGHPRAPGQGVDQRGGHVRVGGEVEVLQPLGPGEGGLADQPGLAALSPGRRIRPTAARPGSPCSRPAGGRRRRRPRRAGPGWSAAAGSGRPGRSRRRRRCRSAHRVAARAITRLLPPRRAVQQLVVGGHRRAGPLRPAGAGPARRGSVMTAAARAPRRAAGQPARPAGPGPPRRRACGPRPRPRPGSSCPAPSAAVIPAITCAAGIRRCSSSTSISARVPAPVAVPGPGRGPERLMRAGEHPGRAGLGQRRRAGQRAGLADQDLQVVIQLQVLIPGRDQPRVDRDQPRAVEDAQLVRRSAGPAPGSRSAGPAPSSGTCRR